MFGIELRTRLERAHDTAIVKMGIVPHTEMSRAAFKPPGVWPLPSA